MALFRRLSSSTPQGGDVGIDPFADESRHTGLTFMLAIIFEAVILSGAVAWYIWGRQIIAVPPPPKVENVQLRKQPKKPPPPKPPPPAPPPPPQAAVTPTNVPIPPVMPPLEPMPPLPSGAAFTPAPPSAPPGPPEAPVSPAMVASFSAELDQALFLCAQGHYPPQALMAGLSGTGTVSFVYKDQRATQVKLVQSTGHFSLDRALVRAVRSCSLPPAPVGYAKKNFEVPIEMQPSGGG